MIQFVRDFFFAVFLILIGIFVMGSVFQFPWYFLAIALVIPGVILGSWAWDRWGKHD